MPRLLSSQILFIYCEDEGYKGQGWTLQLKVSLTASARVKELSIYQEHEGVKEKSERDKKNKISKLGYLETVKAQFSYSYQSHSSPRDIVFQFLHAIAILNSVSRESFFPWSSPEALNFVHHKWPFSVQGLLASSRELHCCFSTVTRVLPLPKLNSRQQAFCTIFERSVYHNMLLVPGEFDWSMGMKGRNNIASDPLQRIYLPSLL